MAQTDNPFLDGMAKAFTDAAGMAQSVRAEIDTFVSQRLERLVADMDFVPREEFEAVKAMAAKARAENEALAARLKKLEDGQLWNPNQALRSRSGCPLVSPSESCLANHSVTPKLWNLFRSPGMRSWRTLVHRKILCQFGSQLLRFVAGAPWSCCP